MYSVIQFFNYGCYKLAFKWDWVIKERAYLEEYISLIINIKSGNFFTILLDFLFSLWYYIMDVYNCTNSKSKSVFNENKNVVDSKDINGKPSNFELGTKRRRCKKWI